MDSAQVYAQKCAACHGATGADAGLHEPKPHVYRRALVGGKETLKTIHPIKSIGNWWPFATTLWDFVNRSMPADKPGSLSASEVYALTAVLFYRNGIIQETDRLDATTLPKIQMPNRNGMIPITGGGYPPMALPGWNVSLEGAIAICIRENVAVRVELFDRNKS
jgi:hypothetical protein